MSLTSKMRRAALALAALGLVGATGACSDLLEVENPGTLSEEDLADSTLVNELANAPIGYFSGFYAEYAYASAILTDEAVSGHNFDQWQDVDARIIDDTNAGYGEYVSLHTLRFLGRNMATRITDMIGDERAAKDNRVAMAKAMEGYALLLLAESHCESPLGPEEAASTSDQIFQAAIAPLEEALAIATAAGNASTINLARVGLARTYLNLGDMAQAVNYAAQVDPDFVAWARYTDTRTDMYNPFVSATEGANFNLGVDEEFQNLGDPRVAHRQAKPGHSGYVIAAPYQTPSFSEWTASDTTPFHYGTDLRYASGLEAQYIIAEAQGPNPTNIAFLNARRAIGEMTPVANDIDAVSFRTALLEQRARDFFMDGHRIGDIRRYMKLYNIDEFPTGTNPNPRPGYIDYGTATCFRPTQGERIANPNY